MIGANKFCFTSYICSIYNAHTFLLDILINTKNTNLDEAGHPNVQVLDP